MKIPKKRKLKYFPKLIFLSSVIKKGVKNEELIKTKVRMISFYFVSIVNINLRRKRFYRSTRMTSMPSTIKDTSATTADKYSHP